MLSGPIHKHGKYDIFINFLFEHHVFKTWKHKIFTYNDNPLNNKIYIPYKILFEHIGIRLINVGLQRSIFQTTESKLHYDFPPH